MHGLDKERRKYPRLDKQITVKYKILSDLERQMFTEFNTLVEEVKSRNISPGGICLKTVKQIAPGTIIALEIFFPELTQPVRALGNIIWSKDLEKTNEFYSGVEFIVMKDKYFDQMTQLIAEYYINKYKIVDKDDKQSLKKIFLQLFRKR